MEVIKTLIKRFESFPEDASNNRNAPFHEAFLKAFSDKLEGKVSDTPFFISLSSWLHGLNTTLGLTFFENVAHLLCNGEKREYTSKRSQNLQIKQTQRDNISKIIADLSNATRTPSLSYENSQIFQNFETPEIKAMDFSADIFYETDDSVVAIELKSVKPNSGEMRGEKQKILEGKAALYQKYPTKKIYFYIGFPFDPTANPIEESVTSYNKTRFLDSIINMNKFFDFDETLVASELWDFLSEKENTMEEIINIINTISTPKFLVKYQLLLDNSKRKTPEYLSQLKEWNLLSEVRLIENDEIIIRNLTKKLSREYNKTTFDVDGKYRWDRHEKLKDLIIQT
jgi:MjaII restriction endonuclease.